MPNVSELSVLPVTQEAPALTDHLVGQMNVASGRARSVLIPLGMLTTGGIRIILAGPISFYVATTGSNSNPGNAARPWATPQRAMDIASAQYDFAGQVITVNIGPGKFPGVAIKPCVGGGWLYFLGSGVAAFTTTLNDGLDDRIYSGGIPVSSGTFGRGECISCTIAPGNTMFAFNEVAFQQLNPNSEGNIVRTWGNTAQWATGAQIKFGSPIDPNQYSTGHIKVMVSPTDPVSVGGGQVFLCQGPGSKFDFEAAITLSAINGTVTPGNVFGTGQGSEASLIGFNMGVPINVTGTWDLTVNSGSWVSAGRFCTINDGGANGYNVTGTVLGTRYAIFQHGQVDSGGSGINYFPGSQPGIIFGGGIYG